MTLIKITVTTLMQFDIHWLSDIGAACFNVTADKHPFCLKKNLRVYMYCKSCSDALHKTIATGFY